MVRGELLWFERLPPATKLLSMQYLIVTMLTMFLTSACVHSSGKSALQASELAADLKDDELLVQTCSVRDSDVMSRVHGLSLRLEVSKHGERWTAIRAGKQPIDTEALVSNSGHIGMTSKSEARFSLAAGRILTNAQIEYLVATRLVAPYSETAKKIADYFVSGTVDQQAPQANIAGTFLLGFDYQVDEADEIGGRFKFQAAVQPVDFLQTDAPFTMPATPAQRASLKPPFAIQFTQAEPEGLRGGKEEFSASWWEEPYFPREARWQLTHGGKQHERTLVCNKPERRPAAQDGEALRSSLEALNKELKQQDIAGDRNVVRTLAPQYHAMMDWITALSFADLAQGASIGSIDQTQRALHAGVAGYCFTAIRAAVEHMQELECKDGSVSEILGNPAARKVFIDAAIRIFGQQLAQTPLFNIARQTHGARSDTNLSTLNTLQHQFCEEPFTRLVANFSPPECGSLTLLQEVGR